MILVRTAFALAFWIPLASAAWGQTLTQRLAVRDLRGNYAVRGTGMFGSGSGSIVVGTVPSLANTSVKCAYLYWDVLGNPSGPPPGADTGEFNGQPVTGRLIGSGGQLDQAQNANYSFWADVTAFVPIAGSSANTSYVLSGFSPATEGASLVLIWTNRLFANRDIVVFDGNVTVNASNPSTTVTLSGFNATDPVTGASVAFIVGDGEPGRDDVTRLNATTIGNSNLDGNESPHWDSDNFATQAGNVPPGSTSVQATIAQAGAVGDSVAWVASPFSVTSPYPDVEVIVTPQARFVARGTRLRVSVFAELHAESNVRVTGALEVYDDQDRFLGYMFGPIDAVFRSGDPPMEREVRVLIPESGVPNRLIGVPLKVVARVYERGTTNIIDDDFVEFVIQ
jgi:hypothetical protein